VSLISGQFKLFYSSKVLLFEIITSHPKSVKLFCKPKHYQANNKLTAISI